jgi:hypothetical protein
VLSGPREEWQAHRIAGYYEYRVVELREGLVGGKMSGGKLEKVLNEHAREG